MKRFILPALLLASAARAQEIPNAVVWLPPETFRRWSAVDALLRSQSDLKLTIGVTPAMATPLVKSALTGWIEKGRVEVAARIDGDPVLSVVAAHPAAPRPQDALERAVEARERLRKRLGQAPAGFIPGAGGLNASVAAALGSCGASWVLAGPYAAAAEPWVAAGRAVLVPSEAVALYDESASTSTAFLAAAESLPRPPQGWSLVGDLASMKSGGPSDLAAVESWPAWDADAALVPPSDPGAKAAWEAYGAAALAVERYQNSGTADLKTLDAAVELLRKAQAARFYVPAGAEDAPPALRAALLAVYKRLKIPAPDSLYAAASSAAAAAASPSPEERPTGVRAISGPGWLEFRAPLGAIALAPPPSSAPAGADGGSAADPWRVLGLRADWSDDAVRLTLRVGRATSASPLPVYDIYVDFNRVLGAGRVPLLEGRGAVAAARDAWELALSVVGAEARLYRARGAGEPEETATFPVQWDASRGEGVVSVPRSFMRGNPARWGWTVVALAEDPARPGRRPAASLVGPDGKILLGALAPVETLKSILSRASSRVPAARLRP